MLNFNSEFQIKILLMQKKQHLQTNMNEEYNPRQLFPIWRSCGAKIGAKCFSI